MKRNLTIACLIGFLLGIASMHQDASAIRKDVQGPTELVSRVTALEHACVPTDTGGGVTQCAQPTISDTRGRSTTRGFIALGECAKDRAYDAPGMLVQCVADYWTMHSVTSVLTDRCVRHVLMHGTPRDVVRLLHTGAASCWA